MSLPPKLVTPTVSRVVKRLKFPKLLALTLGLFVIDMILPDIVPFVDEIMLGMLAALLALWKERVPDRPTGDK